MSAPNKLIGKIEGFTRKYYLNRLIQGVLVGAVLWIVFYLLINGLEYFSWFPPKGRFVLFLFLLAGSAFVAVYYFLIPLINLIRFRKKMSVEQASTLIGKFFPEIKDKLLNTIQLSKLMETSKVGPSTGSGTSDEQVVEPVETPSDNALLLATIEQRSARLSPIRFSDAVDLRGNLKYLGIFFGLLLLLILLMVFLPSFAVQPTQRIVNYEQHFEKPLPYQVEFSQDEIETTQGAEVKFNIHVTGDRIPDAFYVKSELGQQLMTKVSTNDFSYTFKNLYNDLDFNVMGGEYNSQPIHITVHPNPTLLSYRCEMHYPAYLHRAAETMEGKTRLIVPQGTRLVFNFVTRDTEQLQILKDSTLTDLEKTNDVFEYQFVASNATQFDAKVQNTWNATIDPLRFSVDVVPDAYPDIRVESFDEQLSTDVYFSGLVTDDYGFSRLTFNCKVKEPIEKNIVKSVPIDLKQTRTSFFYQFNMDSLGIMPGQNMEVYFEIWDNDGFHGPKSKRSETFTYYKPSEAALDSIANQESEDIMERLSEKSQEADKLQDEIEKMLQDLIQKKDLDWSDKEKMKELMEKQKEIQDEWNKLQEEQEKLADFMKEHDIANEDLIKKQEQINKLFEEVIPEELQKMMEQIDKLLEEMPREQMQQTMQDIKKNNQKMQELLDRNLALLEQLKMEKDLNDLANKLDQLGEELQNQNTENQDKEAGEESDQKSAEEAKEEFDKMMDELDQLLEKNQELQDPFDMQKDEEMQESIDQDLQDAMQNEQNGEQQQSQQNKNEAGQKMKQMANQMMMQMQMAGMEQMAEDAHLVRILLENVVHASHEQEALMTEIGALRTDDPSLTEKIIHQKEVADNFNMVRDSLRSMALRQPMIKNFVFDELHIIENQTENAMKQLNDLKLSQATRHQQTAMMSMNNLALMLAESLENMENSMEAMGMPMPNSKPKPGQGSQSLKNMQQMQQQLSEQLKQMQQQMEQGQQTPNSMSEEFARMAAEQEMLRQGMQQMLNDMKENGQIGDDGLNEIIKDMEKLEEELVNKKINRQMIERSQKIESRMLESQKAQEKREQEEKRKSNEYKGSQFERKIDEYLYDQTLKKNQEFLRSTPIEYAPYYQNKINEYYLKKNTH
ncbi:MAG: hypothetical protein IJ622_07470 [Bacteroidales bacterium]|nr:hypothetical protein [Bacteroidales bacterium]